MTNLYLFEHLRIQAEEALTSHPDAEQVIALQTTARTYLILNSGITVGNYEAEKQFLQKLMQSGDTHVLFLAALWRNREPDLPSFHLRSQLIALDPRNAETRMLMRGSHADHGIPLCSTL